MKLTMTSVAKSLVILSALFFSLSVNALTVLDDGISSDFSNPTVIDFEIGSNLVTFITDTANTGADIIQFTVEQNQTLDAANLLSFLSFDDQGSILSGNQAFFGIIDANNFVPPGPGGFPGAADLLSGLLFGSADVNTDILGANNKITGDLNLTQLTAGEYIFWLNETGGLDIFTLDFNLSGAADVEPVPLPAAFYLMLAPLASIFTHRRKKITSV